MRVQFFGPTYMGRSGALDPSRCINFYPELNPNPQAKEVLSLIGTPGTSLIVDTGFSPVRGLYNFNSLLWIVAGNTFFSWDGNTLSTISTLNTSSGPVVIRDNGLSASGAGGNQLMLVDGQYGYIYNVSTQLFSIITNAVTTASQANLTNIVENFPLPPLALDFMDGYFVVSNGTMGFWASDLYDGTTWDALAVAVASATPDNIQNICNMQESLYIIKSYSTEIWYDAGTGTDTGSPFARQSTGVVNYGTPAPYSVCNTGDTIYFLGTQRGSGGHQFAGVVALQGYSPAIISTNAINYRMSQLPMSDAISFSYLENGHLFIVFTFPTGDATFVYDSTTAMWHERSTFREGDTPQVRGRHIANCYAHWNNMHCIGASNSGQVLQLSPYTYTDNGLPIVSTRIAPLVYENRDLMDSLFFYSLNIIAEMGNVDPNISANPVAILSWSDDGGYTWSNEYMCSMGPIGIRKKRLMWRRLGDSRDRVFNLTISEPLQKILVASYAEVSE